MTEIQLKLTEEKKKQFKMACLKNDENMSDVLKKAIEDYIKKSEGK